MARTNEEQLLVESCIEAVKADPLNPAFWKCLGKALGWKRFKCADCKADFTISGMIICPECHKLGHKYAWHYHALRYFELRLTGGDEEAFWKELTKGNIHAGSNEGREGEI